MNQNIKKTANQAISTAIEEANGYEDEEDYDLAIVAVWLPVNETYEVPGKNSKKESKLALWCKNHPTTDESIQYAETNNRMYYVAQVKEENDFVDGQSCIWLVYVDVTSEKAIIKTVDLFVMIIMILCGGIACFSGIKIGESIERGQERQKKFFENASHELKTPLMSIQGYAEGIYDGVIEDHQHAVSVIMSETDKMSELVDEILCLSRIESGAVKLNMETVSVAEVVNNCLVSIESVVLTKQIKIETNLLPGNVYADAAQLETAVINILVNAAKYAKTRIEIQYDRKSLSIWNDGAGIDKEEANHIFDRFYIGKNGNTGIGLALTREIIEQFGWKISVENYEDGTRFVIRMI